MAPKNSISHITQHEDVTHLSKNGGPLFKTAMFSNKDKQNSNTKSTKEPERPLSDSRPFPCTECSNRYPTLDSLEEHKNTHRGGLFECSWCKRSFRSINKCMIHVQNHVFQSYLSESNEEHKKENLRNLKQRRDIIRQRNSLCKPQPESVRCIKDINRNFEAPIRVNYEKNKMTKTKNKKNYKRKPLSCIESKLDEKYDKNSIDIEESNRYLKEIYENIDFSTHMKKNSKKRLINDSYNNFRRKKIKDEKTQVHEVSSFMCDNNRYIDKSFSPKNEDQCQEIQEELILNSNSINGNENFKENIETDDTEKINVILDSESNLEKLPKRKLKRDFYKRYKKRKFNNEKAQVHEIDLACNRTNVTENQIINTNVKKIEREVSKTKKKKYKIDNFYICENIRNSDKNTLHKNRHFIDEITKESTTPLKYKECHESANQILEPESYTKRNNESLGSKSNLEEISTKQDLKGLFQDYRKKRSLYKEKQMSRNSYFINNKTRFNVEDTSLKIKEKPEIKEHSNEFNEQQFIQLESQEELRDIGLKEIDGFDIDNNLNKQREAHLYKNINIELDNQSNFELDLQNYAELNKQSDTEFDIDCIHPQINRSKIDMEKYRIDSSHTYDNTRISDENATHKDENHIYKITDKLSAQLEYKKSKENVNKILSTARNIKKYNGSFGSKSSFKKISRKKVLGDLFRDYRKKHSLYKEKQVNKNSYFVNDKTRLNVEDASSCKMKQNPEMKEHSNEFTEQLFIPLESQEELRDKGSKEIEGFDKDNSFDKHSDVHLHKGSDAELDRQSNFELDVENDSEQIKQSDTELDIDSIRTQLNNLPCIPGGKCDCNTDFTNQVPQFINDLFEMMPENNIIIVDNDKIIYL